MLTQSVAESMVCVPLPQFKITTPLPYLQNKTAIVWLLSRVQVFPPKIAPSSRSQERPYTP